MTKKQVMREFREYILPAIRKLYEQDGKVDRIARAEEWCNFTDSLYSDRRITPHQSNTWKNPY